MKSKNTNWWPDSLGTLCAVDFLEPVGVADSKDRGMRVGTPAGVTKNCALHEIGIQYTLNYTNVCKLYSEHASYVFSNFTNFSDFNRNLLQEGISVALEATASVTSSFTASPGCNRDKK